MSQVILIYALALLLAWPLGAYLAHVFGLKASPLDRICGPLEQWLYRLGGIDPGRRMDWHGYGKALLWLNLWLALIAFVIYQVQAWLPLNPDHIPNMSWDLALHTAASFVTNTNQQHYAGQAQLSYFAQLFGITALQVITPAVGLAALVAIVRVMLGRREDLERNEDGEIMVGNFYQDLIRGIVRVLLPLAFVSALVLVWQGVPSTFDGARTAHPLDSSAGLSVQRIPVGPVAPMVAIKQLGTNGGGWYGPNSSAPLENPTPLSNLLETVLIILLPIAQVVMAGYLSGRRQLIATMLAVMLALSCSLSALAIWSENQPNTAFAGLAAPGPNMEGKEVRFGPTLSALWGSLTTQTSNGSVNAMHDSFNPAASAAALMGMFINAIFGGVGVGLINFLLFLLLAVFIGSLMVGRGPEFCGRPLETREIKLVSLTLLLHPLLILVFTAACLAWPGLAHNSNPGFHGLVQVLYEYTSAVANNGSGLAGLGNDTIWWNVSCSVCLILGRFLPILAPLAIAASLAGKRVAPVSRGSLAVETPTFAVLTLGVILLFALLSFLPVLVLGPVGEALGLAH